MLHLNNIEKIVSEEFRISSVNIKIPTGKSHVLLGPSGCGKTTLLKIVMGLGPQTSGTILLKGKSLFEYEERSLLKIIGYAGQQSSLFPHLSIFENIALPFKILDKDLSRTNGHLLKLLKFMGIDDYLLSRMPSELSGGQQQRISLVRSLILNPSLVLLDEPLSALDPILKNSLYRDLKHYFNENNVSVLLVTHDLVEAQIFSDEVSLLQSGRIVQQGSFESLANDPRDQFVKDFFNTQRIQQ